MDSEARQADGATCMKAGKLGEFDVLTEPCDVWQSEGQGTYWSNGSES